MESWTCSEFIFGSWQITPNAVNEMWVKTGRHEQESNVYNFSCHSSCCWSCSVVCECFFISIECAVNPAWNLEGTLPQTLIMWTPYCLSADPALAVAEAGPRLGPTLVWIPGIAFPGRCRFQLQQMLKTCSAAQRSVGRQVPSRGSFGVQACRLPPLQTVRSSVWTLALPLPCLLRVQDCRLRALTPKLSAAALHSVLLGVQDCRLPAFKPLNSPQRPYTLSCWGFKTAGCQPSNASTLRSGPTRAFKPLNAPQWPYTVSCWGFKAAVCGETLCSGPSYAVCRPSDASIVRSGPTHSVVGGSRVPFASLQTCIQTVKLSAAALHTVLLRLQDRRLLAFRP